MEQLDEEKRDESAETTAADAPAVETVTVGERKAETGKRQVRAISTREVTVTDGVIEFPFSSEEPVDRWFGDEILSHEKDAADLSRLNDGAPLLFNHDMDEYIGVVEKAWIGEDRRGYVRVRFASHDFAQQIKTDVEAGILRNVSFAYQVRKYVEDVKSGTYTGTDWMAYEVSFVTVPADQTVGVGRALTEQAEAPASTVTAASSAIPKKEIVMENTEVKSVRDEAVTAERARISSINALGEKFKKGDLARQLIEGGRSIDEARAAFLESMGIEQKPVTGKEAEVGMSQKEVRQYSFLRAINAIANPTDRNAWEAAAFEREVSEAAARKNGRDVKGILIPVDVLRSKRDLTIGGTNHTGENIVATDLMADSFIELLRNRSVAQRAGATVMNGLVGNVAIPKQTGGATSYWVAESGAPTESMATLGQVAMTPKTVGAFTDFSRKLMLQSSIDVENMVRGDLAQSLALAVDLAAFYGTGSNNQPTGIKNISGINTKDFAATNPTFAEIVGMESEVAADNADVGTMAYIFNAAMRGALKTTEKASSTGQFVFEPNGTVNGYRAEVSNQIAAGDVFFGNFADLILGFWSGVDLTVDPYAGSTSGTVRVIALQDVDIAVRNAVSFCYGDADLA